MLKTDDYRRLLAVLADVERATSLSGFRRATLDAVHTHLGWEHAAFLTASNDSPKIEGVAVGLAQRRLDALLARLSRAHAARRVLAAPGLDLAAPLCREDLWALLTDAGRAAGEEFLASQGVKSVLAAWLDAPGQTKGLFAVLSARGLTTPDAERLTELAPHLTNVLALQTPRDPGVSSTALLTPREAETVDLVAAGYSNRTIARRLNVTESTVKKHVSASLTKLEVDSRTQLALAWLGSNGRSNGHKRPRRARAG